MSKVSTRWVPRNLNMKDRQLKGSSQEFLEVYNVNPEDFHTPLVTGDETWLQQRRIIRPFAKTVRASLSILERRNTHVGADTSSRRNS